MRAVLIVQILIVGLVGCSNHGDDIQEAARLYKSGQYQLAEQKFEKLIADEPKNNALRFKIAETLVTLGERHNAERQYTAIIANDEKYLDAYLKLAQLYLMNTNYDGAEQLALKVLSFDKDNTKASLLLGSVLAAQNKTDAAYVKVEAILQKNPDDSDAQLLLASLHAKTGKIQKAIDSLEAFSVQHASVASIKLLLANLYIQNNALDKAKTILSSLVEIEPDNTDHYKRLFLFLLNTKSFAEAETLIRTAMEKLPTNEDLPLLLTHYLSQHTSKEAAIAELMVLIDKRPKVASLRFALVDLYIAANELTKAEEILHEIVNLDTDSAHLANVNLAKLYLATHKKDQARLIVEQLLKAAPTDFSALALRGELLLSENKVKEAIEDFRTIISQQPTNIAVLKLLSTAHLVNNDKILAKENIAKIVELTPQDETARLDLISLAYQQGDMDLVNNQLQSLFKLTPNSKKGLETLFNINVLQKKWAQAELVAKQLQQIYPNDAAGFYLLGLVLQETKQTDESSKNFELAIQKQPQAVEPLTQLIKNFISLKHYDKAIKRMQELTTKQPANYFAFNLLGDVFSQASKYTEAKVAYKEAIKINPAWVQPYRNSALIDILKENSKEAKATLEAALTKITQAEVLLPDLISLYNQDNEFSKIDALFASFLAKNSDSLFVINEYVKFYNSSSTRPQHLKQLNEYAERLAKVSHFDMLDTAAWVAFQSSDFVKAKSLLLRSLDLNPTNPLAYYHFGAVSASLADISQAITALQKALAFKQEFLGKAEAEDLLVKLTKQQGK